MSDNYYYKDVENEIIREELLDSKAQELAESFKLSEPKRTPLSQTQLRRFFNDLKNLEKRLDQSSFERMKPLIKMVKS